MRHFFQRLFSLLLLCVAGVVVAEATVGTLQTLAAGSHTLETGNIYLMSAAEETGVTKEWELTTDGALVNTALQVNLGNENNTVILVLKKCAVAVDTLQDAEGNYVPALKVSGNGTLIIRHSVTTNFSRLQIKELSNGEHPVIDLSAMTGGEVRFERAAGESGSAQIALQRVWAVSINATSSGNVPKPVIACNDKVRLTFAENVRVRFQAAPCVVKTENRYVLPELISDGYASMRIEAGAVVSVRRYSASASAKSAGYTWTKKALFPASVTYAGGSLVLFEETPATAVSALIDIPDSAIKDAVDKATGQGEVFGKTVLTVSMKEGVVPEACIKVADGQTLDKKERETDANGRLVIDADMSPELVYAQTSESAQNAVTVFGLTPEITETGCTIKCNFGIADLKVDRVDSTDFVSTLKVSVDLPNETVSTRAFYLRVLQTSPSGTISTIYPATGTAALTTFTRDAADSSRFSASIPCRISPTLGTTSITVRAYSSPPTE